MVALLAAAPCASAALYKWTDANGRVVYSDQPPAGDVKTEVLRAPASAGSTDAVKEMANKEVELKKRQADAAKAASKSEKEIADSARRNQECEKAANNLRMLASPEINLVRQGPKGEIIVLDGPARRKESTDIELWIKANCSPN